MPAAAGAPASAGELGASDGAAEPGVFVAAGACDEAGAAEPGAPAGAAEPGVPVPAGACEEAGAAEPGAPVAAGACDDAGVAELGVPVAVGACDDAGVAELGVLAVGACEAAGVGEVGVSAGAAELGVLVAVGAPAGVAEVGVFVVAGACEAAGAAELGVSAGAGELAGALVGADAALDGEGLSGASACSTPVTAAPDADAVVAGGAEPTAGCAAGAGDDALAVESAAPLAGVHARPAITNSTAAAIPTGRFMVTSFAVARRTCSRQADRAARRSP